tara:strand:+ start:5085 stop:6212 length:1128 start_codon:yes stop_codon:yes gene_type:complete
MKKKILFISANSEFYGAERSLHSTLTAMKKSNIYEPLVIVSKNGGFCKELRKLDIPVFIIPFQGIVNYRRGYQPLRGILKLIFNLICVILFFVFCKLIRLSPKVVHTNTVTTDFGWLLSKFFNIQHVFHIRESLKDQFGFDVELGDQYLHYMMSNSAKNIGISQYIRHTYERKFKNLHIELLYNCVELRYDREKPTKIDTNIINIALVGRLDVDKNWIVALKAARELSPNCRAFRMHFFGSGGELNTLQQYVRENELDNCISFHGYYENIDLSDFDIGLICSQYEAFGRVTAEYALSKLIVVGANTGGTKELLKLLNGVGFNSDDYHDLASQLQKVLSNIDEYKANIDDARNTAIASFNSARHFNNLEQIYQDFL